jgi:hypothetical protein
MRKIFITYRRTEAEFAAGALGRELRRHFGDEQIFRDKENIAGGVAWKRQLLHEIDTDSALLVLIGRDWANLADGAGRRRLDNPADGLLLEISDGIKDGAAIIPVLLENAQMPDERELPPELKGLVEFNALKLRDGDWQHDVETICRTLERVGFKPLDSARQPVQPEESIDGSVATKAIGVKAVVGATLVLLAFAVLSVAELGRADYLGIAAVSVVGLVLGFLTWRETRHHHEVGRILGAVVATVAAFALFAALRGYADLRVTTDPAQRTDAQSEARIPVTPPVDQSGTVAATKAMADMVAKAITGDLPSARSILDRHVAAIGGRAALLNHSSRFAKGTLSTSGLSGPMEWYTAKPNKVLIKVSLAGLGEGQDGFDGTHGWRSAPLTGFVLLTGKELEDTRLESDFYGDLTYDERYASVTTVEQTEFEGRPCVKLRLVRKSGEEEFEFYDVANGLRAGGIKNYESPTGRMSRRTVLAEYRKFGDLLHPTSVTLHGLLQQVITITAIEYDKVPPTLFDLPPALRSQVR